MQHLLQRNVKDAIRKQYSHNVIYKAFKAPCEEYEALSNGFRLSPEEVFYEVMTALDDIIENPKDAVFNYHDYWHDKYNEYRDLAGEDSDEGVIDAASLVSCCLYLCLNVCFTSTFSTISLSLMSQVDYHYNDHDIMKTSLLNNITRLGEDLFRVAVNNCVLSEDYISDEIQDIIEKIPQEQRAEIKDVGNEDHLSLRQLLILLDVGFNVGFTTETTNVSAYSKLVAKMIGGKPESIRTAMNRLKNIDYSSRETKEDVEYLITLIEPVKEELANKLRNLIKED